jgi:hypothetical protein
VFRREGRIASHVRSSLKGWRITIDAHKAPAHTPRPSSNMSCINAAIRNTATAVA